MLVPWTPLSPSRRERGARVAACALAGAAAITLLAAAARSDPFDSMLAATALAAAAAGGFALRAPRRTALELAVDDRGRIAFRRVSADPDPPEQRLQCVFAAPWLITLRCGTIWIPIWPDSVPRNTYRRFWVHIRWGSGRPPADLPAGPAPGQPT